METLKGKTSTWIKKKTKKFPKGSLWSRGYFVSTVDISEMAIREYIYQKPVETPNRPD
jgi:REP element-mobilizing transposase RayT